MCFMCAAIGTPQEILRFFHEVLCEKLRELEKEIPDTMPIDPCQVWPDQAWPVVAEYKLREMFSVVFIVLDARGGSAVSAYMEERR
jgi:hypothetical protein